MVTKKKVAVVIGSLRQNSFSRKFANALIDLQPAALALEVVEIGNLPMYNQDLDESPPKEWVEFRSKIKSMDGVIFVTPEYNRSIPGALKNAIDVGSRPYGASAWDGKPAAVISQSPGAMGGFGANHHLRQCLVFLNMPTLQQPEAYLGDASHTFGAHGEVIKDSTREYLIKILTSYSDLVARSAKPH